MKKMTRLYTFCVDHFELMRHLTWWVIFFHESCQGQEGGNFGLFSQCTVENGGIWDLQNNLFHGAGFKGSKG